MATTVDQVQERLAPAEAGQLAVTWKRFRRHRLGLVGLVTITLLVLACIVVPMVSGWEQAQIDPFALMPDDSGNVIKPALWQGDIGSSHLLGTDEVGRDNLTRLFFGGRISLAVGIITTVIIVLVGGLVGALAGFYGGWVDTLLMRIVDLMLSLPILPILLILSEQE